MRSEIYLRFLEPKYIKSLTKVEFSSATAIQDSDSPRMSLLRQQPSNHEETSYFFFENNRLNQIYKKKNFFTNK